MVSGSSAKFDEMMENHEFALTTKEIEEIAEISYRSYLSELEEDAQILNQDIEKFKKKMKTLSEIYVWSINRRIPRKKICC